MEERSGEATVSVLGKPRCIDNSNIEERFVFFLKPSQRRRVYSIDNFSSGSGRSGLWTLDRHRLDYVTISSAVSIIQLRRIFPTFKLLTLIM